MRLIDEFRDPTLGLEELRARIERAWAGTPHAVWLEILRDATVPCRARRLVIRRLFESGPAADITLAELGARVGAAVWLHAADIHPIDVVAGKLPVRWTPVDQIVSIDLCPDPGDAHQLVVYLRVAGKPSPGEIASGLRGGAGGALRVREIGWFERESGGERADVPALASVVLCRRALCDAETRLHTLIDVLIDIPVGRLPGPASFDVYLQLRHIMGPIAVVLEVLDDQAVLATGRLTLEPRPGHAAAFASALGIAIPNLSVEFARPGAHRLRVRAGNTTLGEHVFTVSGGASPGTDGETP